MPRGTASPTVPGGVGRERVRVLAGSAAGQEACGLRASGGYLRPAGAVFLAPLPRVWVLEAAPSSGRL